jgi:predicted phage terminase large subunit-like protein
MIDLIRDKMDVADQMKAITGMVSRWPKAGAKYVEDKANGAAVICLLKDRIPGLIPVLPEEIGGDKEARLGSVVPFIESGNFYLPANAPWLDDYVAELTTFPTATNDDQVDMTSMALIKLLLKAPTSWDVLEQLMNGAK